MSLTLTLTERLARARGDLRMGVPVVLTEGTAAALVVATEALTLARLAQLRALGAPARQLVPELRDQNRLRLHFSQ